LLISIEHGIKNKYIQKEMDIIKFILDERSKNNM